MKNDERYWVQSRSNGERGWLVDTENPDKLVIPPAPGVDISVRLDRGTHVQLKRYNGEGGWLPVGGKPALSDMAVAKVCWAAVTAFAEATGDHAYARQDMLGFRDSLRIALIRQGPIGLDEKGYNTDYQEIWDGVKSILCPKS